MISDAVALLECGVASSSGTKATDQNKREQVQNQEGRDGTLAGGIWRTAGHLEGRHGR
jgi:hypothetical protein